VFHGSAVMRSFFAFATLAAFVTSALGAPTVQLKEVQKATGAKVPNSYLITLKAGASRTPLTQKIRGKKTVYNKEFINGFAAELTEDELNEIRANPDVALIEEDGIVTISATQTNAPWGLRRISQAGRASGSASALTFTYQYSATGAGVDVYVIDTGIRTTHSQFGGRARWGATFGGYANQDGNGHGTHCAGTIGGSQFGVAKEASLIAVKVLSDSGSGTTADVVSGMNWVVTAARASGRPSVVSMSLGGGASTTVDNAVAALTNAGVHTVVAAGNSAANASGYSPARAPSAITVGAIDINDALASFSNYGSLVDILAPGVSVISSYSTSDTATASLSGTSMATPHVAGLVAYLISKEGNVTPAAMVTKVRTTYGVPSTATIRSDTTNLVANNEF